MEYIKHTEYMDVNMIYEDFQPFLPSNTRPFTEVEFSPKKYEYTDAGGNLVEYTGNPQPATSGSLKCWNMDPWINKVIAQDQQIGFGRAHNGVFLGKFDQEVENAIQNAEGILSKIQRKC